MVLTCERDGSNSQWCYFSTVVRFHVRPYARFLNAICSFGFLDALDEVNEAVTGVEESVRKLVRNIFAYCKKKNTYLPFDLVLLLRSQVLL